MSIGRRIAFGAAASWVSRGVSIVLGLWLMPVLFRHLRREELGVWLLLGQSWATLGILDLGLGVTLTRRIAFSVGKSGAHSGAPLLPETIGAIADLVETGRRLYQFLAIGSFLVAFGIGFFSLSRLHLSSVALPTVWLAWAVLCLAQSLSVWASIWNCLLQGVGYVGWDALVAACISSMTVSAQIVVALTGGGIIGLAIISAVGALIQRFLIFTLARSKRPELFAIRGKWRPAIVKSMAPVALKAWVTSVSMVIVLNTDQFFIAGLRGASQIPAYRAAYVILYNVNLLAVTFALSSSVFISQLWEAGAADRIHAIVLHNLRLGLTVMATGGACVIGLGSRLFNVWIGHGNYIGTPIVCVFFTLFMLEVQSFIISTSSRATEDEAFAVFAVVSAVLNVVLSIVLGWRYGLIGIALATLLAQLLTNHWFMCYRGLQRLQMSLSAHFRKVVAPVALLFLVTLLAVQTLNRTLASRPDGVALGAGMLATATIAGAALWFFVFDQPQRRYAAELPARLRLQGMKFLPDRRQF